MKKNFLVYASLFIISFLYFSCSFAYAGDSHTLVGITWGDSKLVSFDADAGTITDVHAYLNPNEAFRGLTYDPTRNKLYALSQASNNLYSIDPVTLDIILIGKLNIDPNDSRGYDAGALAYNPASDSLYTAVEHWDGYFTDVWSELCEIDRTTAELACIGKIYGPFITSFDFNKQDGYLYGLAVYGSGSGDSPDESSVIRINPYNAEIDTIFLTPYHTMLGFAKHPDDNSYFSWINWTSHFYGQTDLDAGFVTQLGNSDNVDVLSSMTYKSFDVSTLERVNNSVKLKPVKSTFETTPDVTECPEDDYADVYTGKMTFDVELENSGKDQLAGLLLKITDLEEGSLILNAYGGDRGVGSFLNVPKQEDYSDGILSRKDSVSFPVSVCFKKNKPFKFSVDILAVVNPTNQ